MANLWSFPHLFCVNWSHALVHNWSPISSLCFSYWTVSPKNDKRVITKNAWSVYFLQTWCLISDSASSNKLIPPCVTKPFLDQIFFIYSMKGNGIIKHGWSLISSLPLLWYKTDIRYTLLIFPINWSCLVLESCCLFPENESKGRNQVRLICDQLVNFSRWPNFTLCYKTDLWSALLLFLMNWSCLVLRNCSWIDSSLFKA